jgi:hypothetical protein
MLRPFVSLSHFFGVQSEFTFWAGWRGDFGSSYQPADNFSFKAYISEDIWTLLSD